MNILKLNGLAQALVIIVLTFMACNQAEEVVTDYHYAALETETLLAGWEASVKAGGLSEDEQDRLNLHVRAIFAHRCFQCHSTSKHKGALILDHKDGVFEGGDGGAVIVPFKADESEIIRRVKLSRSHEEAMPTEGAGLTKSEIAALELWIDQGAHWTDADLKIFREAEMALTKPSLEDLDKSFQNPIDQWVDSYFTQEGLNWPKTIDDRRFIRKIYLDIVGLLPDATSVEYFVKDPDPQKRDHLIRRLLEEDEDYALHWLSFWNDLLRNDYSGTGFITNGRKQISGWLYQALYENMPYDTFVHQLIDPSAASEGFIQGIKWRGAVNASQSIELQAAQNISQSLLGINLKCASCHNSFVNNVTLQQAYDFAQVFVDSTIELYRCDKPTGRYAKPSFLYPELGPVVGDSVADRLASLAEVIVQPDNGRLYRTVVNRYWDKLLGRGLIAPVDEMDNPAWSQALLDWLTADFRDQGYDLKQLLYQITSSETYQLEVEAYPDPYLLRSPRFVFKGPVAKRLTAEQMADAFSGLFSPLYRSVDFDPDTQQLKANWIWHRQVEFDRTVLPYPEKRFLRKTFRLGNQPVQHAEILCTADHSYTLFLNETEVGTGKDWRQVDRYLVTDWVQRQNIIAVEAENDGEIPNPAGLLFAMKVTYQNGTSDTIVSDNTWLTIDRSPEAGWRKLNFRDTAWSEAWRAGSSVKGHWGKLRDFNFDRRDTALVRAALVKLDPFLKGLGRPVRENVATQRDDNTTLLQALLLSNDQFFAEAIKEGAGIWLEKFDGDGTVIFSRLWQNALGRNPTSQELKLLEESLDDKLTQADMEDLIWSILLLPEFQFI